MAAPESVIAAGVGAVVGATAVSLMPDFEALANFALMSAAFASLLVLWSTATRTAFKLFRAIITGALVGGPVGVATASFTGDGNIALVASLISSLLGGQIVSDPMMLLRLIRGGKK